MCIRVGVFCVEVFLCLKISIIVTYLTKYYIL